MRSRQNLSSPNNEATDPTNRSSPTPCDYAASSGYGVRRLALVGLNNQCPTTAREGIDFTHVAGGVGAGVKVRDGRDRTLVGVRQGVERGRFALGC